MRSTVSEVVKQGQNLRAELFDVTGRRVARPFDGSVEANRRTPVIIDGSRLPAGVYMLRIHGEDFVETQSVVILH